MRERAGERDADGEDHPGMPDCKLADAGLPLRKRALAFVVAGLGILQDNRLTERIGPYRLVRQDEHALPTDFVPARSIDERDAVRRRDLVEVFRKLFLTCSVYVKPGAADLARELRGIAM